MEETTRALLNFLDASPSCYHAVHQIKTTLKDAGYQELLEFQPWELVPGGQYYAVRGDSSIIAFRVPKGSKEEIGGFQLAAAHSDSPSLKLRENAEVPSAGNCIRLGVEPYGGMIYRSWLDRPLSMAGRVVVRTENGIETRLINVDRDLLVIPSLAIHMNRKVNQGVALNPAVDLLPLFGSGETGRFRALIAETAEVAEEDLLSTELFLYPRTKGTCFGAEEDFVASPRLDDLQCAFGCLQGFLQASKENSNVPVLCIFNNEEVGSGTRQGADSTFLTDVLSRIGSALGCTEQEYLSLLAGSFMVSADNAHAIHPAHPEMADKQEHPVLNGGIVIKYNAGQH